MHFYRKIVFQMPSVCNPDDRLNLLNLIYGICCYLFNSSMAFNNLFFNTSFFAFSFS